MAGVHLASIYSIRCPTSDITHVDTVLGNWWIHEVAEEWINGQYKNLDENPAVEMDVRRINGLRGVVDGGLPRNRIH